MIRTTRALSTPGFVLGLLCAATLLLLGGSIASAAEGSISYTHESFQEYEKQLAGGKIEAVTINKHVRSIHVTLKDGSHVLAKYAAHEEPKVVGALQAKGITATIESKSQAAKEVKPVKHKLRYIAGGILIVVVLVVGAVLVIDRKRKRDQE